MHESFERPRTEQTNSSGDDERESRIDSVQHATKYRTGDDDCPLRQSVGFGHLTITLAVLTSSELGNQCTTDRQSGSTETEGRKEHTDHECLRPHRDEKYRKERRDENITQYERDATDVTRESGGDTATHRRDAHLDSEQYAEDC